MPSSMWWVARCDHTLPCTACVQCCLLAYVGMRSLARSACVRQVPDSEERPRPPFQTGSTVLWRLGHVPGYLNREVVVSELQQVGAATGSW